MKITIHSKEFKQIVERISCVCRKNAGVQALRTIYIIADEKEDIVTFKAANLGTFVEVITKNAIISEGGKATADMEAIPKLFNIPDMIEISTYENKINVKGSKKQGTILNVDMENEIEFPKNDGDKVLSVDKEEAIETITRLSSCLSVDEKRQILTGFNFDLEKERIVTCNGFELGLKNISNNEKWNILNSKKFVIPGFTYQELKKISSNKKEGVIEIFVSQKYAYFVGEDFTYIVRILEGEYFNIDNIISIHYENKFSINRAEFYKIIKEYLSILKVKKNETILPMYLITMNGKFISAAISKDYKTSDIINVVDEKELPEEMFCGYSPAFMRDIMEVMQGDNLIIEYSGNNNALVFENEDYKSLVLPIRVGNKDEIIDFIKNMV